MQGKSINGFTLQRLLGQGGMGEVWYAENEIGKQVAVKILSEELSHNAQMRERFLREAKVMMMLNHPNIRKVFDHGTIDDRPVIVMEYLEGEDLKARMKRGQQFQQEELVKWWNQLVLALSYTSQKGVVHRDIKPGNLFVDTQGNVKLLDFGIAKEKDGVSLTQTGSTLGTLIYMSPEQVKDPKRVGPASDVYSLAVSFVHLLTGKAPYDKHSNSDYDIQESIVRKPLDLSGVPDEWRGFLMPYLAKNPEGRPHLMCFESIEAPSDEIKQPETTPNKKPKSGRQGLSWLLILDIIALVGAGVWWLVTSGNISTFKFHKESPKTVLDTFNDFVKKGDDLRNLLPEINENTKPDSLSCIHLMESIEMYDSALIIQQSHSNEISDAQYAKTWFDSLMEIRQDWFEVELNDARGLLKDGYPKTARRRYNKARILALPEDIHDLEVLDRDITNKSKR